MNTKIYDNNGNVTGDIELEDKVYNIEVNEHVIWEAIKNELANDRQGTHNTKTRSDVNGGGRKPYRQKGTGRARQGTSRSPIHRSGGIVFGPHPRDYSYKMPKKSKRLAFRSILTKKIKSGSMRVIDDFTVDSGKTKDAYNILSNLTDKRRVLLIYKDADDESGKEKIIMLKRSVRNIKWVNSMSCYRLRAHDLFYAKEVLITKSAAELLNTYLLKGIKGGNE
jgi:large subunit ribosomal protein L4